MVLVETLHRAEKRGSVADTRDMLDASPAAVPAGVEEVAAAIDACLNCVQSCTSCSDADLAEDTVAEMTICIALCLTCADVCAVAARVLSRVAHWDPVVVQRLLQACVRSCTSSADECHRHAPHHRHCAICEQVCRACIEACNAVLRADVFRDLEKAPGA
jgi:hypothetical protein